MRRQFVLLVLLSCSSLASANPTCTGGSEGAALATVETVVAHQRCELTEEEGEPPLYAVASQTDLTLRERQTGWEAELIVERRYADVGEAEGSSVIAHARARRTEGDASGGERQHEMVYAGVAPHYYGSEPHRCTGLTQVATGYDLGAGPEYYYVTHEQWYGCHLYAAIHPWMPLLV